MRLLSTLEIGTLSRGELEDSCRQNSQIAYIGETRSICRSLTRYKVFVRNFDLGFAPHLMLDGFWEVWLTQFIARTIKPGSVVIDIGANFGYYSTLMADLVGPAGHCIGVEPNPDTASDLQDTLAINGFAHRTTLIKKAITERTGENFKFIIPSDEPKNARLIQEDLFEIPDVGSQIIEVKGETIDNMISNWPNIDFIKIDAEGAEIYAIKGMTQLLKRCRPTIVMEFNAARPGSKILLDEILQYYPKIKHIDFSGSADAIEPSRLMVERGNEDWLLLLSNN